DHVITPDGARVIYRETQDGVSELYAVPIDASQPPVKLSRLLPAGAQVSGQFALDPLAARVVYPVVGSSHTDLYSAPLDASSPPVLLNPTPASRQVQTDFQ